MILAFIGFIVLGFLPILYIWCIKPNKSIQEGLKDWIDESADDV